jgi:hypothetical protein
MPLEGDWQPPIKPIERTHLMLDTPHITQTTTQLTAVIRLTIPRDEIQNVMGPGIAELMATIAAQGITPTGPWFDHHLKMAEDPWDFEIGVPVSVPVVASGRVKPSQWLAMKVARTVYRGPYEGLADVLVSSFRKQQMAKLRCGKPTLFFLSLARAIIRTRLPRSTWPLSAALLSHCCFDRTA